MIPEFGHYALALAFVVAVAQATLPLVGIARRSVALMVCARTAGRVQALLLAVAFGSLALSFVAGDFSVAYVAAHSNVLLPRSYRIAAVWGGHEGSLLLWTLLLSGVGAVAARHSRRLDALHGPEFAARLLAVLGLIGAAFLASMLFQSNPFLRLDPVPLNGRSLNPLLQDPLLAMHPPLLYLGYVGLAVVYATMLAGLLGGRLDAVLLRWARLWVLGAWLCLTLGILLGSRWSYYEAGWGGWWSWDPVENAALMPWLVTTALMHALPAAQRGLLRAWTVSLAASAFALSLLGTFLLRSGLVSSVHAFASDPARGVFIVVLMALVLATAVSLLSWRLPMLRGEPRAAVDARVVLSTVNILLLSAAALIVLLGTLLPLSTKALGLGSMSVGAGFYGALLGPVLVPSVLLLGASPLLSEDATSLQAVLLRLRAPFVTAAVVLLAAVVAVRGARGFAVLGSAAVAGWILGAVWAAVRGNAARRKPGFCGMLFAHAGVVVFVAGAGLSGAFGEDQSVRLSSDADVQVGGYRLRLRGQEERPGPNYWASRVRVQVTTHDGTVFELYPERRRYNAAAAPTTEVAVHTDWLRDVHLALGEEQAEGAWTLRVQIRPFMRWIWAGGVLTMLGAAVGAAERAWSRRHAAPARTGLAAERKGVL